MKKTTIHLVALLLALLMLTSVITGAFAEDATATPAPEEDTGIIDGAALKQWADSFAQEHKLDEAYKSFSIGFCYTGTGDSWYYDADIWMYSASMYKVPVAMLLAEKVASGELTQESIVNGTTVEYVESTALTYSNNDSGHSMVSYLGGTYGGKCSDMTEKFTDLPADYFSSDFIDVSYYTARYMTQVMKTLYDGGDEKFPHVIEYLLQAQPGAYFKRIPEMENQYQIAQKFGSYEEPNGNNNNHCTAIIYTPTPIIVTVMTRNVMDYQNIIALVGEHLAAYSLELDQRLEEWKRAEAEKAAAEAAAAEAAAAAAENTDAQTMTAQQTEDAGALSANGTDNDTKEPAPDGSVLNPASGGKARGGVPLILIILAALLVVAIVVCAVILLIRRRIESFGDWPQEESSGESQPEQQHPAEKQDASAVLKTKKKPASDSRYRPRH